MTFNSVVLVGRLTRDPELRTTNTGKDLATFAIAVNKRFKPQDGGPEADFFDVKAWGQTAGYVSQYIGKGRLVLVQGRVQTRKYQDKDGNNREAVEIVADQVAAMDKPKEEEGGTPARQPSGGSQSNAPRKGAGSAPSEPEEYDPWADS